MTKDDGARLVTAREIVNVSVNGKVVTVLKVRSRGSPVKYIIDYYVDLCGLMGRDQIMCIVFIRLENSRCT